MRLLQEALATSDFYSVELRERLLKPEGLHELDANLTLTASLGGPHNKLADAWPQGVAKVALYERLADVLQHSMRTSEPPIRLPSRADLAWDKNVFEETALFQSPPQSAIALLHAAKEKYDADDSVAAIDCARQALKALGDCSDLDSCPCLAVRSLLGMRSTEGSTASLPPSRQELLAAFVKPHSAKSKLHTGARALSKHAQRSSEKFWGDDIYKGTEGAKNRVASSMIIDLMNTSVWLNTHLLPHAIEIFEIRAPNGYGARWSLPKKGSGAAIEFRGFLEPPMVDGHVVGWKH
jgi:hypothetical protein